jgi:hypothetical protein
MIHRSSLNPTIASFKPVGDKLLLRRHPLADKIGEIVLPGNARHTDLCRFDVIDVGPKCEAVKAGDIALAPRQLTFGKVSLNGEDLEVAPEGLMSAFIPA